MRASVEVFALIFLLFACATATTDLRQSDFVSGTLLLVESGTYRLVEDIVFNPNSAAALGTDGYDSGEVLPSQFTFAGGPYDPAAFGIGFFAAVAIFGDGITFDLNGHTMSAAPEFALQQKFYSHIELADRPFMPTEGPHDFGSQVRSATNVVVKNGRFGLSPHHAIHGNGAINVTISNLVIEQYEVAAIALNGVKGAVLRDLTIRDTRRDVATLGTWSSARFIRRYMNYLVDTGSTTTLRVRGVVLNATQVRDSLRTAMNNAFNDIVTKGLGFIDPVAHPDEYALFHNTQGMLDGGACYGLLLNRMGSAVLGFPSDSEEGDPAERVRIQDVTISNIALSPNEVVLLSDGQGGVVVDAIGAGFQLTRPSSLDGTPLTVTSFDDSEAEYVGSVVSNAQALVDKAIKNGDFNGAPLDTSRSLFPQEVLDWVEATPGTPEAKLSTVSEKYPWVCNGDAMFHVNKGIVALRLDASEQTTVSNVHIRNLVNANPVLGSEKCDYTTTTFSHPDATLPGFGANVVRGVSIAGSYDIVLDDVSVKNAESVSGTVFGVDILTDAHVISCRDCEVSGLRASLGHELDEYDGNPTEVPRAIGFRVDSGASDVLLDQYRVSDLIALGSTSKLDILGADVFAEEANDSSSGDGSSNNSGDSSSSSSRGSSSSASLIVPSAVLFLVIPALLL